MSEVQYLVTNCETQCYLFKAAGEKSLLRSSDVSLPFFVDSRLVDDMTDQHVLKRLFALAQDTDLLGLKDIIRDSYQLANFARVEHDLITEQTVCDWLVFNKHYTLMMKLVAISIDGFKSDRYMNKISDITETINRARKQLLDEEQQIQKGQMPAEEMDQALQRITGYLLKVETLINEKVALTDKLQKKQFKWQTSDSKFKERKATLQDIFRTSMAIVTQICRTNESQNLWAIRISEHEKALLMIDDVFIVNRTRSVMFMSEVEHQI